MVSLIVAILVGVVLVGDDALRPAAVALPVVFVLALKLSGLYERDEHLIHKTTLDEVPTLLATSAIASLLIWVVSDLAFTGHVGQPEVLAIWLTLFVALVFTRRGARTVARTLTPPERCLLVGNNSTAEYVREKLALSPAVKAELVGHVSGGRTDDPTRGDKLARELEPLLRGQGIDRVILAIDSEGRDDVLFLIGELKRYGVKVSVLPEASSVAGSAVELDQLHGMTLLGMRRFEITRSSRLIKRTFDVVTSALLIFFLSPILIATAIAIRLDTPGPVLFRQRRIGLRGEHFTMLKFRSMVSEAEQLKDELQHLNEGAAGLFKMADDPRVTRVGRFIRKSQIDELPQLFNVLRGEMSLVGPRPLIPAEDCRIEGRYRRRLEIRPGMTGHWQILGSSRTIPLTEMVKLDYLYLANWSLWSDVRLLLRTIPFVVGRRGM